MIKQHKPDLTIYRVPEKTLEMFKRLAKEEFCNDYGMALKWLLDNASTFVVIFDALNDLNIRMGKLENRPLKKYKYRTMLDGKTKIKVKR